MAAATVTSIEGRKLPQPRFRNEEIANGARMALLDYLLKGGVVALPPEIESQLHALCARQAPFVSMFAALGVDEGCETPNDLALHLVRLIALR